MCPACRVRLRDEYDGIIENVTVQRVALSEENRVGIGTFQPSDPKSQDISELTGSIDFSTITEYGSESIRGRTASTASSTSPTVASWKCKKC